MKVGAWSSVDGRIRVQVRVYTRRDSFLRALRSHGQTQNNRVRGTAITYNCINYSKSKQGVKNARCFVFLMHDWVTPGVLAHEFNHIAHHLARYFRRTRIKTFEETVCCYLDELMDIYDPWMHKNRLYRSRKNKFHGLITP